MAAAAPRFDIIHALRDAGLAALVAALLAFPLLGFKLDATAQGLALDIRLIWIVYAAALVFSGRLLLATLCFHFGAHVAEMIPKPLRNLSSHGSTPRLWFYVASGMLIIALILPWLPFSDRNLIDKATLILIYVMLGWGLNIVVGLAGLLDLGYVAFYAVGAYCYALLSAYYGVSFWICLPLSGLLAALLGIALGFPVLRLRGDYLAIVTLGFGEIVREVLINWDTVTNGPRGILLKKGPSFFGLPMTPTAPDGGTTFSSFFSISYSPDHRIFFLYYLILMMALLTNGFTLRIRQLPLGRAWEALREDETACRSLGINSTLVKLSAFAIGASLAGFAGSFFATRQGFISPESFTFIESAIILAIVVLGGMGSQMGIVFAAILLVGLPEWFREFKEFRMIAFGAVMVLIMLWRPQGLLSHREPTVRLSRFAKWRAKESNA